VALAAVKGGRSVSELASACEAYPTMTHQWNWPLLEGAAGISGRGGKAAVAAGIAEDTVGDLHAKIGEMAVANDFCHESSGLGPGSEARNDRAKPSQALGRDAAPPALDLAVVVLLRAAGRDGDEP